MEGKERNEHILALKVMRLTRPTLSSPLIVTSDAKDLPGNLFNNDLKHDITSVSSVETLAAGQFLLLPQSFGNIYLGETFSSYICVHNDSNQIASDVSVKVDLQTNSQRIPLSGGHSEAVAKELHPQETVDDVIHHEVKEVGTHILLCEVSYNSPMKNHLSFRKFFKFEVFKPLDVKTKFYNAESDEVYLEAQVQNITSGPICLEKVSLESSHLFNVTALNSTPAGESVFGRVNVLQPQASRQFLYCLAPQPSLTSDLRLLAGATNIGKLDIVWRSNLGERGRLQTSQLQRMAPDYGDIRLSVQELPNIVVLEEAFTIVCRIINTCERSMDLVLGLESSAASGLVWSGVSGRQMGKLEPGASVYFSLCLVPTTPGLQNISGIRLTDIFLKRTYDYDELAQVFVTQKSN
ncbi:trafficking protein particle complex subunit 13 isoform X1 [Schistocerca gregaria]|uniref:trafficking protein particle complex subunit 13 isoform X1 n=2 Tax=Schistocerca gregaria TaxID=7010 RepID=UPI00211E8967|nr:trafficking protein particle complex subunit 13 isoform X1 [Schistocerca gregaria]